MKKLNSKGFGAIEVILILVIIGIMGGVGWYVSGHRTKNDTAATPAPTTDTTTKATPKKVNVTTTVSPATGTIVKSTDGKVQFNLPTDWKVESRTDGGKFCGFTPTAPAPGVCITDISYKGGSTSSGYTKIFKSTESASAWHKTTFVDCGNSQNKTLNGNPELICTPNPDGGRDYTISNGQYVVYIAGDNSKEFQSVVVSVKFLN